VPLNWGAVSLGGIAGVGAGVVLAMPVVFTLGGDAVAGQALLILAGFAGQFLAGYLAGAMAGADRAVNGGLAALGAYAATSGIAIAAGADPGFWVLAASAVVALVLGTAGGVLSTARRSR